jgi:FKBP-type peptidyl-prolyl cis-trans isomerase 2
MEIEEGCVVTVEYTVRLEDGTPVDSTGGCGPVSVMYGSGQLFPAIEDRIADMRAGETRELRIPAAEAYGAWRPELVRTMPRERLPPELELTPGEQYRLRAPDGKMLRFRLLEIEGAEVKADFNAPEAGKDLLATVTIVGVRAPTLEEERRGRV